MDSDSNVQPGQSGDVQDPAKPYAAGQDSQTEENGAGEGTDAVSTDAAPTETNVVPENRAADVGGEPANRWSGDHPDNDPEPSEDEEAADES